jgi:hypothetical protein
MKTFKELLEEKVISENMEEIQEMAYTDVQIAFDNAKRIMEMMDEGIEPESWNYSKITMAADYLTSVYTAMRAKKSEMPDMPEEPEMNYFSMYGEEAEQDKNSSSIVENKGLWYNIRKRREKGLPRKKPGDKGYPETLDIKK